MPPAQVNDVTLNYQRTGQGPALLLIHGLGGCAADWEPQIAGFSDRYTVITYDQRGHGASQAPAGPYSMAMLAADASALVAHLGIGSAHVVGLSLGGAVAFQLAVDHPAQVRSLTIVNSAPAMLLTTFKQKFAIWQRLAIIRWLGLPRMGQVLGKRLFPDAHLAPAREAFVARFAQNQIAPYLASLRALIGWSVSERLPGLKLPTLIVAADGDYTPVAFKQAYVAQLPNARLEVIGNAHHAVTAERPDEFNRVLEKFLAEQPQV